MFRKLLVAALVVTATAMGAAPTATGAGKYANCTQAHDDGRWDIPKGDPDYFPKGDADHDGVACES
jgi:hypothetical protein